MRMILIGLTDAFRGFKHYSSFHGPEQALKIIANERLVLEKVEEFVKKHNVQCDLNVTNTFDVCLSPEFAAYEAEAFASFKKAGGDVSHVNFFKGKAASEKTGLRDVIAAYEWPAGSSHPAKLAQWLLSASIERGVRLFTHCPVSKVENSSIRKGLWDVYTPRGEITTPSVIHCTNAYAALLLPQLEAVLTPNRAQAHSLIAPPAFSSGKTLTSTLSLRYSLQHFYSLFQQRDDGTLVFGVSRTNPTLSAETLGSIVSFDDSHFIEEILEDALKQWKILFPDEDATIGGRGIHGEGLDNAWTGIIGMTGDAVPFVGPVEGLEGQWLCAGFGGHGMFKIFSPRLPPILVKLDAIDSNVNLGMARIFTCAPGVAKLVTGKSWSETGLPECFQLTKERVAKMAAKQYTRDQIDNSLGRNAF